MFQTWPVQISRIAPSSTPNCRARNNPTIATITGGRKLSTRMDCSVSNSGLNVEGWDQPTVEITVTKSMEDDYGPEKLDRAQQCLERVRIIAERQSDTDVVISTILPPRGGYFSPPLPPTTKGGVLVDYEIHVPRDAGLVIHHGKGYVSVSEVTG